MDGKFHKMYILIFTCLNERIIHVGLVPDMGTQAFIQALVRFCNIYGTLSRIYSDNARSFIAALGSNGSRHHIENDGFSNIFANSVIKHVKIRLYSPWIGSTLKRMIKVVKSCLFKSIGRSKIKYYQLLTLLSKSSEQQTTDLPMFLGYRITPIASFIPIQTMSSLSKLISQVRLIPNLPQDLIREQGRIAEQIQGNVVRRIYT